MWVPSPATFALASGLAFAFGTAARYPRSAFVADSPDSAEAQMKRSSATRAAQSVAVLSYQAPPGTSARWPATSS